MAFPYLFFANFEQGTSAEWTSETDTASQLDFPHYVELARSPHPTSTPFKGAYCARARLTGGTADAFVTSTSITYSADAQFNISFNVWFSPDFNGTANDTAVLLELQSSGPVIELSIGFRVVAATGVINMGIGETAPTAFDARAIDRGQWYTIEVTGNLDAGGGNDGDASLFVTRFGEPPNLTAAASVSTLDQAAITQAVFGIQDHLATTKGTILLDQFITDDARVYPRKERHNATIHMLKTGHAFIGPGTVENITLVDGGSGDTVLTLYDTDRADILDPTNAPIYLHATANSEIVDPAGVPVSMARGAYVVLTGTNPRAIVKICKAQFHSVQGYKILGLRNI